MDRRDRISSLIESIHACALDSERWPEALKVLAELTDGIGVDMYVGTLDKPDFSSQWGLPQEGMEEYLTQYHGRTQRTTILPRLRKGTLLTEPQFIDEDAMRREPFYEDFLRRWDYRYFLGGSFGSGIFGIQLPFKHGPPHQDAMDLCRLVIPHMDWAIRASTKIEWLSQKTERLFASLECLQVGVIILNRDGHIAEINDFALRLMREHGGLGVKGGRLTAAHRIESGLLRRLIDSALHKQDEAADHGARAVGRAVCVTSTAANYNLEVTVVPLTKQKRAEQLIGAVLLVRAPGHITMADEVLLANVYNLTPAEARFVCTWMQTASIDATAERLGLSRETVRSHMKQVFQKTDTHSQVELMRLLASGPFHLMQNVGK